MTKPEIEKLAREYAEIHFRKDINLFGNVVADFKAGYLKGVESLREENEKLKKQVDIAKHTLKYISRITYGTEISNTPEENNEILADYFFHHQQKAKQALEEIERVGK